MSGTILFKAGSPEASALDANPNSSVTINGQTFGPAFSIPGPDAVPGSGVEALPDDFFATLQPASWRGQPFAVRGTRIVAGRRKALHEYPFRDGVWVEDLGKRGRVHGFEGFLIGDNVGNQIKSFVETMERAGSGPLVHPTFGILQCEVIQFEAGEEWDAGGMWRFRAEFLEPVPRGLQLQPDAASDTSGDVDDDADDAEGAVSGSFLDTLTAAYNEGASVVYQVQAAVQPYISTAIGLVGDARRMVGLVRGLPGPFGRFASFGSSLSIPGVSGALSTIRRVQSAVGTVLGTASAARSVVLHAGNDLSSVADLL